MPSPAVMETSPAGESDDEVEGAGQPRGNVAMCEECGENDAKYRCPGCGLRSCSLPCVRSHKERANCSGKRIRTGFVSVADYDDNVLMSDYNLLEEMLRQTDAAKRLREPLGKGRGEIHPSLRFLQRQAKNRCTSLLFCPQGMSKRKSNTSFYEKRTKRILWRVEWTFEGTGVRLVNHRVDENLSLGSVLEKHLSSEGDVMLKHRLRNFVRTPLNEFKLLFPKEPCTAAEKAFYELNQEEGLRQQLADRSVIEYPVINVVLPADAGNFVTLPRWKPALQLFKEKSVDVPAVLEPEGIPFREEEIEEGEILP